MADSDRNQPKEAPTNSVVERENKDRLTALERPVDTRASEPAGTRDLPLIHRGGADMAQTGIAEAPRDPGAMPTASQPIPPLGHTGTSRAGGDNATVGDGLTGRSGVPGADGDATRSGADGAESLSTPTALGLASLAGIDPGAKLPPASSPAGGQGAASRSAGSPSTGSGGKKTETETDSPAPPSNGPGDQQDATRPNLTVSTPNGVEDHPIPLNVTVTPSSSNPNETLAITVAGVPAGASLSAGTDNGDGTWTLTPAQLSGLTLTPPADFSGSISLTVTATSSVGGTDASTSSPLIVTVAPEADAPTLAVAAASGIEDQPIALTIASSLVSPAPGETLAITVAGVPAGASLSAGTDNGDGTWTLTPAQLAGLTLTPPADFSGSISLTVTATSSVNGTGASTSSPLTVTVAPEADAPTLAVAAASGIEDQPVALTIASSLVAPAPGETLAITVAGVPAGASLSAGTDNGDGTWTLTPAQLAGLTLTPPADFSGSISLTVTATSSVNGTDASTSSPLTVTVAPEADAPALVVAAASGIEDQPVALTIASSLVTPAPGETLTITVAGVPAGASLSAGTDNGDGTWTLTPAQLAGLTLTPPVDFSGSISLTVTATSSVGGTDASNTANLTVAVAPEADAPTLAVAAATGIEDQPVALTIASSLVSPAPGETLAITVAGVPAGASLSAGTDNGDGTWTLTPAQLAGLTLTPPADYSGSISLTVTATSSVNGADASSTANLTVSVAPEADAPTLAVAAASGIEDQPIALTIASSLVSPAPGETLAITVAGVPAGASLSAGTDNGDGTWTLTPAQLAGLTLTPPVDFSGSISLTVTATSSVNGTDASTSSPLTLTVAPEADAPTLAVAAATGIEDQPVALTIASSLVSPAPGETLAITVAGVPAGASLSAGTDNGDGTWTLTPAQLTGLTLTPPADFSGSISLTVTATSSVNGTDASTSSPLTVTVAPEADAPTLAVAAASGIEDQPVALTIASSLVTPAPGEMLAITVAGVPAGASLSAGTDNGDGTWTLTPAQLAGLTLTPPADFSGSISLTVTATSTVGGTDASISSPLTVTVAPEADAPTLAVAAASGVEDQPVALTIASSLVSPAPGETLAITVAGVPAGASLSAGTDNGDGTWTLTPAQLAGLTLTPPANFFGSIGLTVTATSSLGADHASTTGTVNLSIAPVADAPTLTLSAVAGIKDQPVALNIVSALVAPAPGETLSVTVAGIPTGASLSAGTDNGDGTWTLTSAQLSGLTLMPPADFSGSISLTVTATSSLGTDQASTTGTVNLSVAPVADAPTLAVSAAAGLEDQPVALNIAASMVAATAGETLSITVAGVPAGASLSAGHNNGDGTWTLTPAQLTGLTLLPPADYAGTFNLTVTATSSVYGSEAVRSAPLSVTIAPLADPVSLSVVPLDGMEDQAILLHIAAAVGDIDGSESLSVTVSGLPAGASLSVGALQPDGSYVLTGAQIAQATLNPPANYSGSFTLSVQATATDALGGTSSVTSALPVSVHAVADAPTLSVGPASGTAGAPIALSIASALTDSSEVLSVTVAGVPAGAVLNHGTLIGRLPDGSTSWVLTPAALSGLTMTTGPTTTGTVSLTVTAISSEGEGGSASTAATLPVSVAAAAAGLPTVTLDLGVAAGIEDHGILLNLPVALSAALGAVVADSVVISGLPVGASLSAGTSLGNNSYSLTPAQLVGLQITPPANSDADFTLNIKVNAGAASVNATLDVAVTGAADAPTLSVSAAAGTMNAEIALTISGALTDTDGSESLSYIISNVPTGAHLSAGINGGDGAWSLTPAQLAGLTITPPLGYSGTINLGVTAVAQESDGGIATTVKPLAVTVSGSGPTSILGALIGVLLPSIHTPEDTSVNIGTALLTLNLGGIASVQIDGVPSGATLSGGTLSNGIWTVNTGLLNTLKLTPAANDATDIHLTVTAKVLGLTVSLGTLDVLVDAVADLPTLTVLNASGVEDQPIALGIVGGLTDLDGSEALSVSIAGLPVGAKLSAGHINPATGNWILSVSDLAGLKLLPPPDYSGTLNLQVSAISSEQEGSSALTVKILSVTIAPVTDAPALAIAAANGTEDQPIALSIGASTRDIDGSETITAITISGLPAGATLNHGTALGGGVYTLTSAQLAGLTITPPANYSGTMALSVTATAQDGTAAPASTSGTLSISVAPVADTPTLSAASVTGLQGQAISLDLSSALTDTDGSETLSVTLSGLPAGASLSAGLNDGNGQWTLTPAQLSGLKLTMPASFTGDLNLTATANSMEGANASIASTSAGFVVHVTPAIAAPALDTLDLKMWEDGQGALAINLGTPYGHDTDIVSVTISGLPVGASLSAGHDDGNGSWTLTPAQLAGLTVTPRANSDADFTLTVTATATNGLGQSASTTDALHVTVLPLADAPMVTAAAATGDAHHPIALTLSAGLVDGDGSESLSLLLHGVPDGAHLSAGIPVGAGTWSLSSADLQGLTLTTPPEYVGTMHMSLSAASTEANGGSAESSAAFTVTVGAEAAGLSSGVAIGPGYSLQGFGLDTVSRMVVTLDQGHFQSGDHFSLGGLTLETGLDGKTMVGGTNIELVGGGSDGIHNMLTFRGDAGADIYQQIVQSLHLQSSGESGDRSIGIDIFDQTGSPVTLAHLDITVHPDPLGDMTGVDAIWGFDNSHSLTPPDGSADNFVEPFADSSALPPPDNSHAASLTGHHG